MLYSHVGLRRGPSGGASLRAKRARSVLGVVGNLNPEIVSSPVEGVNCLVAVAVCEFINMAPLVYMM